MRAKATFFLLLTPGIFFLAGCVTKDREHQILISVAEQRMLVLKKGQPLAEYPVSTSKFALSDIPGSKGTPLGRLEIARKIGARAPSGMKFKDRRPTGEIVPVNAPGRDPIVTRILWLKGLEPGNRNAYKRYIYIHGTAEENRIGTPASFGCVRMRSADVIRLFETVGVGAQVRIVVEPLPQFAPPPPAVPAIPVAEPVSPSPPPPPTRLDRQFPPAAYGI